MQFYLNYLQAHGVIKIYSSRNSRERVQQPGHQLGSLPEGGGGDWLARDKAPLPGAVAAAAIKNSKISRTAQPTLVGIKPVRSETVTTAVSGQSAGTGTVISNHSTAIKQLGDNPGVITANFGTDQHH